MDVTQNITIGTSHSKSVLVTCEMTVAHFHDDMPEVYGTPMMIYLMEVTATEAIQKFLPEGWATVGAAVKIKHLAGTPVGFTVTPRAEGIAIRDRLGTFTVGAHDG